MAAKKTNTYIGFDLEWLESKTEEIKEYVDAHPLASLTERIIFKETSRGGTMPIIAATIEQQITNLTRMLKDYAQMLEVIEKLREQEATKSISSRGDQELTIFEKGEI